MDNTYRQKPDVASVHQRSSAPDIDFSSTLLPPWSADVLASDSGPTSILLPTVSAKPPAGCAPDAIKLFVGNIPKHFTEQQLLPLFESVGKVVELSITRDKASKASKGSAFLWYSTVDAAQAAIQVFNMRHALPELGGKEVRPLAVRPANIKVASKHGVTLAPATRLSAPAPAQHQSSPAQSKQVRTQHHQQQQHHQHHQQLLLQALQPHMPSPSPSQQQQQQQLLQSQLQVHSLPHMQPVMLQPHQVAVPQLMAPAAPAPQQQPQQLFSHSDVVLVPNYSLAQPAAAVAAMDEQLAGQVSLCFELTGRQLLAINEHLYSVHAMSGAQITVMPRTDGLVSLTTTGHESEVEDAKQMLSLLLSRIQLVERLQASC